MIPYLLATAGGYLIGNATKDKQLFADGGDVKNADDWTVGYEIFGGRKMYFLYNKKSGVIRGFFNNKSDAEKKLSKYFAKGGGVNADIWECVECGDMQGRHDMWFDGDICGKCKSKIESNEKLVKKHLAEISRKKAKVYNLGWSSGDEFITSKTNKGNLHSEIIGGKIEHEWYSE
jgi:hypothetical protein